MSEFIKYVGQGRPVLKDDYIEVKLVSGEKVNGHGADFIWWKNINGMGRADLKHGDVEYYRIKEKSVKSKMSQQFKNDKINGDIFHVDCTPEGDPDYNMPEGMKKMNDRVKKIPDNPNSAKIPDVRSHNIGDSDYAKHAIQPWDIWLEYDLNGWDCDIVKRVLRNKESQSRRMDYEKIIHNCQERIRQIDDLNDKGDKEV